MEDVLRVTDEEKVKVLKYFKTNKENVARDVTILKEWYKKQPHLPQGAEDDEFFEKVLLRNKFRIEKAKDHLDDYFTMKGLNKDFFDKTRGLFPSKMDVVYLPLPYLTKEQERIVIVKVRNSENSKELFDEFIHLSTAVHEFLLRFDYSVGFRCLIDFKGIHFEHIIRLNPSNLSRYVTTNQKAYASRLGAMDFFNIPPFFGTFLGVLKRVMSAKLMKRVSLNDNVEALIRNIPKNLLPKEYGGTDYTEAELLAKWDRMFIKYRQLINEKLNQTSDEKQRIGECKYSEMFGVEGTFKKLNID